MNGNKDGDLMKLDKGRDIQAASILKKFGVNVLRE